MVSSLQSKRKDAVSFVDAAKKSSNTETKQSKRSDFVSYLDGGKVSSSASKSSSSRRSSGSSSKNYSPVSQEPNYTSATTGKASVAQPTPLVSNVQSRKEAQDTGLKNFSPFFSVRGQKERLTNVKDTFKLIGIKTGNLGSEYLTGDKYRFGEVQKPTNLTRREQATQFFTSPLFVFGAPAAAAGASATAVGTTTTAAASATQAAASQTVGRAVLTTGTKLVQTAAAVRAQNILIDKGADVITNKRLSQEQRSLITSQKEFDAVLSAGYQAQAKAAQQQGFFQALGEGLTPALGNKQVFEQGVREELKLQGYTQKEIDLLADAALKQRQTTSFSEAAKLLNVGRGAENVGQVGVKEVFKFGGTAQKGAKTFFGTFARGATGVAPAGAFEGFFSVFEQASSRKQQQSKQDLLFGAGLGGISAGLISGGTTAALTVKNPLVRATGTAVDIGANLMDPFEKPSDIFAGIQQKTLRRITGSIEETPIIAKSGNKNVFAIDITPSRAQIKAQERLLKSNVFTLTTGESGGARLTSEPIEKARAQQRGETTFTPSIAPQTQTKNKVSPKSKVRTIADIFNIPTNIKPSVNPNQKVPVPIEPTPPIPVNVFPETETQVEPKVTPTPFTNILTQAKTITALPRIPPPLPFDIGFGSGMGGSKRKTGSKFINEVALAQQAFQFGLFGDVSPNRKQSKPRRTVNPIKDPYKFILG